MEKQEKAQKLLKLIILLTGIAFIGLGLFSEKILSFLHSSNLLLTIQKSDMLILKYAFLGMGIMDIVGAFLFPKFLAENKK